MSALEKAKQQPMLSATSRAMNRFILRLVSAGSAPPPAAATHRRAARSRSPGTAAPKTSGCLHCTSFFFFCAMGEEIPLEMPK